MVWVACLAFHLCQTVQDNSHYYILVKQLKIIPTILYISVKEIKQKQEVVSTRWSSRRRKKCNVLREILASQSGVYHVTFLIVFWRMSHTYTCAQWGHGSVWLPVVKSVFLFGYHTNEKQRCVEQKVVVILSLSVFKQQHTQELKQWHKTLAKHRDKQA